MRRGGTWIVHHTGLSDEACPAPHDPADLASTGPAWADARLAGHLLDDLDRQALARLDDPGADLR
jgi:hypothetical protein